MPTLMSRSLPAQDLLAHKDLLVILVVLVLLVHQVQVERLEHPVYKARQDLKDL
jgi:hypothetical protein